MNSRPDGKLDTARHPHRWSRYAATGALLTFATLGLACEGFDLDPHRVQAEISRQMPGTRFHLEEDIHLGRFKLGLVKGVVRLFTDSDEDAEARAIMRAIDRVHVTTYRISGRSEDRELAPPPDLVRLLGRAGWMVTADIQEDDERTFVLSRFEEGDLRGLYVIQLDETELALVHIEGRGMTQALVDSIRDDPKGLVGP